SPIFVGLPDDDVDEDDEEFEDPSFWFDFSLLLRLQAATTNTSSARGIRFLIGRFILFLNFSVRAFYVNNATRVNTQRRKPWRCGILEIVPLSVRPITASTQMLKRGVLCDKS